MKLLLDVAAEPIETFGRRLGYSEPFRLADSTASKPLPEWKMEEDDAPILRYIYRHAQPRRHLEFGTWQGAGVVACLESCGATVWTINLPEGKTEAGGRWTYADNRPREEPLPAGARTKPLDDRRHTVQTDSHGFIGHLYISRGLGHRVCQILADSREWDISNYPPGFFESCLIDGGHDEQVVISDLHKALNLVRSGGLIIFHDFCPVKEVRATCPSTVGVLAAVGREMPYLKKSLSDMFWIKPSWLLVGVRR
ncbi:MAG: class I SAM-dependent methyltransferase [Alphaproteobacteria bacterium]|nr:class I SAM-dependent methyltransferase [Alphaproteobacteria bacterium]